MLDVWRRTGLRLTGAAAPQTLGVSSLSELEPPRRDDRVRRPEVSAPSPPAEILPSASAAKEDCYLYRAHDEPLTNASAAIIVCSVTSGWMPAFACRDTPMSTTGTADIRAG